MICDNVTTIYCLLCCDNLSNHTLFKNFAVSRTCVVSWTMNDRFYKETLHPWFCTYKRIICCCNHTIMHCVFVSDAFFHHMPGAHSCTMNFILNSVVWRMMKICLSKFDKSDFSSNFWSSPVKYLQEIVYILFEIKQGIYSFDANLTHCNIFTTYYTIRGRMTF